MNKFTTHYDTLQVVHSAEDEVIKASYRVLSQKHHPDKNPGNELKANQNMKIINAAYSTLSDPKLRVQHDEWIKHQESELRARNSEPKKAPSSGFFKPVKPSEALAAIVGRDPLPRTEITKKVWDHIKTNNLQDAKNKRLINADAKLKIVFGGKTQVSMFEMTKLISDHLTKY